MIKRSILNKIHDQLRQFPAIAILGPRQVGKTTLAKTIVKTLNKKSVYLDIERPSDRLKLSDAETYLYFQKDHCVILDEIQYMPELFNILRPLIDESRKAGRFIITGSASPDLVKGVSESLAGRIAYIELAPIGLSELPKSISLQRHWFRGGFPDSLTAKTDKLSRSWLDNFIKSYIERDLNQLFHINLTASLIRNFWHMLSYNNSAILNAEDYARALSVTNPTVHRYLDYLEGAYLIRRLHPWFVNVNKRLVKSPKIYIRDCGLLHRLAGIETMDELRGNTLIGASWEGYVIEQISQALPANFSMFFYRTHNGAEVDLVLVKKNKVQAAIEIKVSAQAQVTRGFYESTDVLKPAKKFVLSPYGDAYPGKDKTIHCSLKHFLAEELPKI
ncbi:ATP-binding protein [Niabella insulamsoli]|uniref:ATP-binding protein n=1 Tax=Niabella insulamsoli TaxID=3144874 RepID=UPI0031FE0017